MLPIDFYDVLNSLIESYVPQSHIQDTIELMHNEKAQTGVVITTRVTRNLSDMIVSADTDYTACLAKECTCLKYFKYNSNSNIISDIILYKTAEVETYRWSLALDWDKSN